MLLLVSPAKDLDFQPLAKPVNVTQPAMLAQSQQLADICKGLTPADLSSLMHISDKLAGLNAARFAQWQLPFTEQNAKAALFAFNGDVYQGLDAGSLTDDDIHFAQQHLRILSGLYGVLRPLDLMQPYRLEMGTKLITEYGRNLYEFWDDTITRSVNEALAAQGDDILINLASNEYFKSIDRKGISARVIDVEFKDFKKDKYKIISFYAKKARGLMSRFMIEHQITNPEDLSGFDYEGYYFDEEASTEDKLAFKREGKK